MEHLGNLINALFQPINCVGNLGHDLLQTAGNFFTCVGGNLGSIAGNAGVVVGSTLNHAGDAVAGATSTTVSALSSIAQ